MASLAATILQGKHEPTYTPHIDTGDCIVVINCEKLKCTSTDKTYYWHTGHPGGIKSESIQKRMARKPEEVLKHAIKLMLPRTKLGREMFTKLKVYAGTEHPHAAQMPQLIDDEKRIGIK